MTKDELTRLREMRADTPAAAPRALRAARSELLREAGRRRRLAPFPVKRLGFRLAGAGGLAVVLAVGLVMFTNPNGGGPNVATDDSGARMVLREAAVTAGARPPLTARPDQFIYVESVVAYQGTEMDVDGNVLRELDAVPTSRRIWLAVDGNHDGLLQERPRSGSGAWTSTPLAVCGGAVDENGQPVCNRPLPSPYLDDLPTDADHMRDYLYRNSHGANPADEQAFITVGDMIRESYVPPASLAAMFEAAAEIPGVTVGDNGVDAAGRHGITVGMSDDGLRTELIFDPDTYAFLGEREIDQNGHVTGQSAVMRIAVVDEAGQLP